MFQSLGEYEKATEYHERAVAIRIEIGDRAGEASSYGNLGTVFQSLREYYKAREYHEKALAVRIEIGDRAGEASSYRNLGTVFQSLGEYEKAREYVEKALAIRIESGGRAGEASPYGNLGTVFQSLGEYDKARKYHEKALAIKIELGDRTGEASSYDNLGDNVTFDFGEYRKSKLEAKSKLHLFLREKKMIGSNLNCFVPVVRHSGSVEINCSYFFSQILSFYSLHEITNIRRFNESVYIKYTERNTTVHHPMFERSQHAPDRY